MTAPAGAPINGGKATMKLALAGDTMLGRLVAELLRTCPSRSLVADEVVEVAREADLFVLNLECCISERGEPWPDPDKRFFFRAPPAAVHTLTRLGVDCVTLANNHALDFGEQALLDTFKHLADAGIAWVGAGPDLTSARAPACLTTGSFRLGVVGVSDHHAAFEATSTRAGIAFADLEGAGVPDWLLTSISDLSARTDAVLVTPHWGPNRATSPVPHVLDAAPRLLSAGATLVAGHSAHVFHGIRDRVLYDLGDFLDDYRAHPLRRNDLSLLFLITLDPHPRRLEAIPLKLERGHTRLATGEDTTWIRRRLRKACAAFGTEVRKEANRLVITWPYPPTPPPRRTE